VSTNFPRGNTGFTSSLYTKAFGSKADFNTQNPYCQDVTGGAGDDKGEDDTMFEWAKVLR